ncbi:INTEGRATOR COMPLEX SUBUNIT 6-like protein [Salix purpurea]|uniref:INTEGRATOR COMPLEX SUBUNIT 6-like protein n=2 Tax=Salix TaxID=40685 RepID=A0A9Q0VRL5_SALPP|nr:INTEGRATOR COMPLEX SUBUNIT 6-like protein [Salix purpurea]
MTADVSSMVNSSSNSEILITKDLLGGFSKVSLDLDLQVTKTWDVPVNLKSTGKVCSQRCNSVSSPSPSLNNTKHHKQRTTQESEVQDSKFPPLKFLEERCLELKLVPSSHCESHCESVCTLDKVKSALQRAEKETMTTKKRSPPPPPPTPTPPTSDINRRRD